MIASKGISLTSSLAHKLVYTAHFAAVKHRDQRRKGNQSPYINHPLGVANILASEGGVDDVATLQAAMLHDTVEDCDCTLADLEQEFGREVRDIVAEVTDDKALPKHKRKLAQIEHAKHGMSDKARLVKISDKIYNLRDLCSSTVPENWTPLRVQGYFVWAKAVVDAGVRGLNTQLDQAFDEVLQRSFTFKGATHPCIPPDADLTKFLDDYIASLVGTTETD